MRAREHEQSVLDEDRVWAVIRELARLASSGNPVVKRSSFCLDEAGCVSEVTAELGWISVDPDAERGVHAVTRFAASVLQMLELYLPLCLGKQSSEFVIAHVGQSLDGQIATASGASRYVTGPENLRHMHRLRALSDAVIVGAGTVERDDPQLTTRLVPGPNPARVVIDPSLRLSRDRRVYQDQAAPTLVVCERGSHGNGHRFGHAEVIEVPGVAGILSARAIITALQRRGYRRLFIEGGGVTVSRFLEERALGRLHVTVCPLFIGSGHAGIILPAIDKLEHALRPSVRHFSLGQDVLFDCQLNAQS